MSRCLGEVEFRGQVAGGREGFAAVVVLHRDDVGALAVVLDGLEAVQRAATVRDRNAAQSLRAAPIAQPVDEREALSRARDG